MTAFVLLLCLVSTGALVARQTSFPALSGQRTQADIDASYVSAVQEKLVETYPARQIDAELDAGGVLKVILLNPAYYQLPEASRQLKSAEIARFVKLNYDPRGIGRINIIEVDFATQVPVKVPVFGTGYQDEVKPYRYRVSDL